MFTAHKNEIIEKFFIKSVVVHAESDVTENAVSNDGDKKRSEIRVKCCMCQV